MKIFIVIGTCGEYSDRNEWLVKAFIDEGRARELVEKATMRAAELQAKRNGAFESGSYIDDAELQKQDALDPNIEFDYTGTTYCVAAVTLEDA